MVSAGSENVVTSEIVGSVEGLAVAAPFEIAVVSLMGRATAVTAAAVISVITAFADAAQKDLAEITVELVVAAVPYEIAIAAVMTAARMSVADSSARYSAEDAQSVVETAVSHEVKLSSDLESC